MDGGEGGLALLLELGGRGGRGLLRLLKLPEPLADRGPDRIEGLGALLLGGVASFLDGGEQRLGLLKKLPRGFEGFRGVAHDGLRLSHEGTKVLPGGHGIPAFHRIEA
jgi:hypothetical protein